MTVNEYLNQFIQLSRYTTDDVNTDEKKQDVFLKGLHDELQFQLLNIDYPVSSISLTRQSSLRNKIKEMEKDDKCKMVFLGQHSRSNTRPRFSQLSQFVRAPFSDHAPMQVLRPQF
jgi:hypothetical protein